MGRRQQRKGNGRRAALKKIRATNTCSIQQQPPPPINYNSMNLQSEKIRRRQTTASKSSTGSSCPTILVPTNPLPLAVYQPNRLFAMLLVSLLLPKNTFSLRWLALSGVSGGGGAGDKLSNCCGRGGIRDTLTNGMNMRRRIPPSYTLAMTDPELVEASPTQEEKSNDNSKQYITTLWEDVTSELEKSIVIDSSTVEEDDIGDWSIDSIFTIPRGGGRRGRNNNNSNEDEEKIYAGLINLGNTCYLNSQLQCAYHVPYLRQLIKAAKDQIEEVEVEVEVEVDDEEDDELVEGSDQVLKSEVDVEVLEETVCEDTNEKDIVSAAESVEDIDVETSEAPVDDEAEKPETNPQEEPPSTPKKKKTIIQKEMKEEVVTISYALQALKVIFNSLTQSKGGTASTSVLCRTLGINPYLQQDGQEFWKLFVPELDNDELTSLYSGYFEDYVREIIPEEEDNGEEKKDDDDDSQAFASKEGTARERIRTEPFLDLSIPVAEGTGGSVESTLQEMFTEPEILRVSEGNGWRPSKGADKVDAYKGSSLKRDGLPSLLQLHLKRFKYDWETEETSKINDCCSFPVELDLSEIIPESDDNNSEDDTEGNEIYDLQSIVIHKGEYGSGHYYSYVRPDIRSDDWYRFDDEFVTKVDYSDVVADAYGGSRKKRRKRPRSNSLDNNVDDNMPVVKKRRRWGPIRLLLGIFRRVAMIGSNSAGRGGDSGGFGYGGRSSNAYMLQYVRRSDIPKLYLEE